MLAVFIPLVILPLTEEVDVPSPTYDEVRECDIREFYSRLELEYGTKILDRFGNIEEGEAVLVSTSLESGNYEVEVKRLSQNFYQVIDTDIVIETNYCSVYATYREVAILMVESKYGFTKGTIIFE